MQCLGNLFRLVIFTGRRVTFSQTITRMVSVVPLQLVDSGRLRVGGNFRSPSRILSRRHVVSLVRRDRVCQVRLLLNCPRLTLNEVLLGPR